LDNKVLIGLLDILIKEAIAEIHIPEAIQGPRGRDGLPGADFSFEDHSAAIQNIIVSNLPSREELVGPSGKDGVNGENGLDGKDFVFEEHSEKISSLLNTHFSEIKDSLKLRFEDLTIDEMESLRGVAGPRGKDGEAGKDFIFEDHSEKISSAILSYIESIKEQFKLTFEGLTQEEKDSLRGEKGERGNPGRDFHFEEHQNEIKEQLETFLPGMKLKFSDLSSEEVAQLKLTFSDLSEQEKDSLKGKEGARGQRGARGAIGERGSQWSSGEGIPSTGASAGDCYLDISTGDFYYFDSKWELKGSIKGLKGENGKDGKIGTAGRVGPKGKDGLDAAYITDIKSYVNYLTNQLYFIFYFSDATTITTNGVDFPKAESSGGQTNVIVNMSNNGEDAGTIIPNVSCDTDVYVGAAVYRLGGVAKNGIATSSATSNIIGIVESKQTANICTLRVAGVTGDIFSGLDETKEYYLSDTVPGLISTAAIQNITGYIVLKLGQPYDSGRFLFMKGIATVKA